MLLCYFGLYKLLIVLYWYNECEVSVVVLVWFVVGECVVYVLDVGMLVIFDFGVVLV